MEGKIPWAAEDMLKMLTREKNKTKLEIALAFVLKLTCFG